MRNVHFNKKACVDTPNAESNSGSWEDKEKWTDGQL